MNHGPVTYADVAWDRDLSDAYCWIRDRLDDLWCIFHMADGRPRIHPITGAEWRCACAVTRSDACYRMRYPRPFDEDEPVYGDSDYETCECSCHDWESEQDDCDDPPPGPHDNLECPCGHEFGEQGVCGGCNCADPPVTLEDYRSMRRAAS